MLVAVGRERFVCVLAIEKMSVRVIANPRKTVLRVEIAQRVCDALARICGANRGMRDLQPVARSLLMHLACY